MNFAEFLAWLYSIAQRVIDWFWYLWGQAVDVVTNVWNWINDSISWVYNAALTYAIERYNDVVAWAGREIQNVFNWFDQIYQTVSGWIEDAKSWLLGEINQGIYGIQDWISGLFNFIYGWVSDQIDRLNAGLTDWVESVLNSIRDEYNGLQPLRDRISSLLTITQDSFLGRLFDLVNQRYSQLIDFFNNPLGFITGALWPVFETMICWTLAAGLGTLRENLPPRPAWSGGGGGGEYDAPIPDQPSGLIRPVEPLYISGYTFNPGGGHPGVDFGLADGQAVRAVHSGLVLSAGWNSSGFGNCVVLSGDPYWSLYAHLKQVQVIAGQTVSAGQIIGLGNSTGNSTGPHLHFQLKVNGQYVNPVSWL